MSTASSQHRAVVLTDIGPPTNLQVQSLPTPTPRPDQVLIRIHAFGLNRSEMFTRQGHSPGVQFPRVLGIECVGVVSSCPSGKFAAGDVVATAMGGMGRDFDGGYAEFTCVPVRQVQKLNVQMENGAPKIGWDVLGAMPEMVQTSWGSLVKGLQLKSGESLLVRGATTSIGLMAAALAQSMGVDVAGTSRRNDEQVVQLLQRFGVRKVLVDDGHVAAKVKEDEKFDKVLELIGTVTLRDSLRCTKPGGIVCNTGIVGNSWALKEEDRNPMELIPKRVYLTAYGGGPEDFMDTPLQDLIEKVEKGEVNIPVGKMFKGLESVVEAHQLMEANKAGGKIVIVV